MLNDNSLGDRLNAVKQGKPIPKPPMQPQSVEDLQPQRQQVPVQRTISLKAFLLNKLFTTADVFAASFLYGFGIKTIFGLDWTLFGALAVGFLFNHAITIFPKVIKNLFKK
jgi:hypothetical protein